MLLVIDNYDSFTYNLVQAFGHLGVEVEVHRNDAITVEDVLALAPDRLVISPGPGTPASAGISVDVVRRLGGHVPILGVCLGHQCIAEAFGGRIVRAGRLMHGKVSQIRHDARALFASMPQPFIATRYHSLIVEESSLPEALEITARSEWDEIMGIRHRHQPIEGVQFHPESFLTEAGSTLLKNFLSS